MCHKKKSTETVFFFPSFFLHHQWQYEMPTVTGIEFLCVSTNFDSCTKFGFQQFAKSSMLLIWTEVFFLPLQIFNESSNSYVLHLRIFPAFHPNDIVTGELQIPSAVVCYLKTRPRLTTLLSKFFDAPELVFAFIFNFSFSSILM